MTRNCFNATCGHPPEAHPYDLDNDRSTRGHCTLCNCLGYRFDYARALERENRELWDALHFWLKRVRLSDLPDYERERFDAAQRLLESARKNM
jgi:hypothetical protein